MNTPDRAPANRAIPDKLLVTVEEAAALLSVSRATVYVLLKGGTLPSLTLGRSRRIPLAALRELIEQALERGLDRCS